MSLCCYKRTGTSSKNNQTPESSSLITRTKQAHLSSEISFIKQVRDPMGSQNKSALISLKNKNIYQFDPGCTMKINLASGLKCVFRGVRRTSSCLYVQHSHRMIMFQWWNSPLWQFYRISRSYRNTVIWKRKFVLQLNKAAAVLYVFLIQDTEYIYNIINIVRN